VLKALIFDVDGTLAETEELHRVCFNKVFTQFGLDWHWTREIYGLLLATTGGKERIARFVTEQGLPALEPSMITQMHQAKNMLYVKAVEGGALSLRPGVKRFILGAHRRGLKLGIATTTSRSNFTALMKSCFPERECFSAIVCGEDVGQKKPNPEVFILCLKKLNVSPTEAVAIEDSAVGLAAALAAGIPTVVTPSAYTSHQNFAGAMAILPKLSGNLFDILEMQEGWSRFGQARVGS
jgi:HAD superfamily hydrolase (TIGR01509 family)